MKLQETKFLKILRTELEDLDAHIEILIARNREREERGEETEHVCLENVAVLRNEECGIDSLIHILDATSPADYGGLDEMIDAIRRKFRERIDLCGMAMAVYRLTDRKIERVRAYVTQSHPDETHRELARLDAEIRAETPRL